MEKQLTDEAIWKRRFAWFALSRIVGALTIIAGVAITFSDLVRPGGWPLLGGALILFGLLDALVAPKLMKAHWQRIDAGEANDRP